MYRRFRINNWFKKNKPWIIFVIVGLFIILSCVIFVLFMKEQPWDMNKRGQIGDMFGVLGALFSGLAFAGLIVTLIQQHDDLKLQREDLKLQRQELAHTNLELEMQRKEMESQNKTIMLQRFENTFFNMLEMQKKITDGLEIQITKEVEIAIERGRFVFNILINRLISDARGFFETPGQKMLQSRQTIEVDDVIEWLGAYKDIVIPYYRHMYRIMKYVDEYDASILDKNEKYGYFCILRSTLSNDELVILFYLCLSYPEEERKFKKLAEKYNLFKHLRENDLINPLHKKQILNSGIILP